MPKYKKVEHLTGVGYEYHKSLTGYTSYYKDGMRHKVDGPAIFDPAGTYEKFFLEDVYIDHGDLKGFKFLLTCDLKDVPLYLHSILDPVAKWRLENG